jgi:hypothetical protein
MININLGVETDLESGANNVDAKGKGRALIGVGYGFGYVLFVSFKHHFGHQRVSDVTRPGRWRLVIPGILLFARR